MTGTSQTLFPGMRITEASVLTVKNKSHSVTAKVTVPAGGAEGVIITQGGRVGGWSLYAKQGKLKYCYNFFGIQHFFVESDSALPPGEHELRMQFKYDGGGVAKGGDVTLEVDGKAVGKGRVERTIPMGYSADEACDVGDDSGSPTSPDYGAKATPGTARSPGSGSISATTARTIWSRRGPRSGGRWRTNSPTATVGEVRRRQPRNSAG